MRGGYARNRALHCTVLLRYALIATAAWPWRVGYLGHQHGRWTEYSEVVAKLVCLHALDMPLGCDIKTHSLSAR